MIQKAVPSPISYITYLVTICSPYHMKTTDPPHSLTHLLGLRFVQNSPQQALKERPLAVWPASVSAKIGATQAFRFRSYTKTLHYVTPSPACLILSGQVEFCQNGPWNLVCLMELIQVCPT